MTLFGLPEAQVRELAAGVRGVPAPELSIDAAGDCFARAAWSGICEPGDGAAGLLVAGLGPRIALTAVLDAWPPEELARRLRSSAGVSAPDEPDDDDALAGVLAQGLQRWRPRLSSTDLIRAGEHARRISARLLGPDDALWPTSLNDLGVHAPIALWWRGRSSALQAVTQSIALVGARAATGYGEHVAMEASAGLVDRGFAIVSGAAYGIDGMAHRAALASDGVTVAFLAGGVDRFYPSGHDALLTRIVHNGAVVSELPCGAAPTKWRFLQRNRLIAAASAATVVLEAGWRSGSLNTAGHASALGRPLGAVPGPVTSPTSAGCHRLIREYDAICVTTAAEMAELVGQRTVQIPVNSPEASLSAGPGRTSDQIRVFDALSVRTPRPVGDIARRSGLSRESVQGALGGLDLEGAVRERESGWCRVS